VEDDQGAILREVVLEARLVAEENTLELTAVIRW
jgi:hypothetical protein